MSMRVDVAKLAILNAVGDREPQTNVMFSIAYSLIGILECMERDEKRRQFDDDVADLSTEKPG